MKFTRGKTFIPKGNPCQASAEAEGARRQRPVAEPCAERSGAAADKRHARAYGSALRKPQSGSAATRSCPRADRAGESAKWLACTK